MRSGCVEADQPAVGMDPGRPQPVEHRAMENALQIAAANAELRHIVSGVGAAQLLPDRLAEAIAVEQLASSDAGAVELRQQAEPRQNADGVRQHVEADAEFAQLRGLLEYLGLDSRLVQRGRGKPADTAPEQLLLSGAGPIHRTDSVQIAPAVSSCANPKRVAFAGSTTATGRRDRRDIFLRRHQENVRSEGGEAHRSPPMPRSSELQVLIAAALLLCRLIASLFGSEQKEVGAKCRDRLRECV